MLSSNQPLRKEKQAETLHSQLPAATKLTLKVINFLYPVTLSVNTLFPLGIAAVILFYSVARAVA